MWMHWDARRLVLLSARPEGLRCSHWYIIQQFQKWPACFPGQEETCWAKLQTLKAKASMRPSSRDWESGLGGITFVALRCFASFAAFIWRTTQLEWAAVAGHTV